MFVEIIGDQSLPDAVDRDDIEDLLELAWVTRAASPVPAWATGVAT
jgi:hypothetical protein